MATTPLLGERGKGKELFGHAKCAFTGAVKHMPGKFELSNGGTLFLDEIGDMSLQLQAKLSRSLRERVVERIGGWKSIPLDVRVVCAAKKPIEQRIERNEFRDELFYRISAAVIMAEGRPGGADELGFEIDAGSSRWLNLREVRSRARAGPCRGLLTTSADGLGRRRRRCALDA